VETSLDLDLQQVAERALENHLTRLEELNRMKIRRDALASGRHHDSASTPYLQGAALALDPRTGEILVLVGGRDFDDSNFNRAIQAHRQSGSAFKPFIYLAAIEKGFRPSDVVVDAPLTVHLPEGTVWQPQNYEKDYSGAVTLRHALAHSINIPAVKLLRDVGPETAIRYARRLGIQDRIPPYLSIALGSNDVTLIDLAGAYGVFATSGTLATPLYVLRVLDKNGRRLEENRPSTREVLDAPHAYIVTSMLKSVLNNGTAYAARAAGFTAIAAGKTGTTDDFTDAWFVGFTPDLVAGTWVGFDEKKPIGPRMSGAVAALPVWTEIMIEATRGKPARDFPVPRGVAFVTVCGESGRAASGECPNPVEEVFIDGTEPREPCFLHGPGRDERLRDQWIRRNRAIEGEEIDL
jgi:penicillin-binding protein 1A